MGEHEAYVAILRGGESSATPIDSQNSALIVVDMQRYFTHPSFPFADVFNKLSPGLTTGYLNRVPENGVARERLVVASEGPR